MINEEKAYCLIQEHLGEKIEYFQRKSVEKALLEMAELKDKQSILELGGWHTEPPTEDGWYLVDTPDFPKNCHCVVAEWDNDAKSFYDEHSDYPINFNKWKLIEKR